MSKLNQGNAFNGAQPKDTKKEAKVKSISPNKYFVIKAYINAIHPTLRRNLITLQLEENGEPLPESKLTSMFISMTGVGGEYEKIKHADWLLFTSSDHIPTYNPLTEYFNGLNREAPSFGTIKALSKCLILDHTQGMKSEQVELFLMRWLIGMVAGIYDDNHNPLFIVLVGPKGCGKKYFARHLLPDELKGFVSNIHLSSDATNNADAACSILLAIIDEMDYLTRYEANGIRSLLSTDYFTYRPKYARINIKRKRLCSFLGTSNEMEIITDKRNNRRIIPICITGIDWQAFNEIDKTELIRETFQLFYNGEDWNLKKTEIETLESLTGGNAVIDIETEMLINSFISDETGSLPASEIVKLLQLETPVRLNSVKVGKALSANGYKQALKREDGKVKRCWLVRYRNAPGI